jgi:uncharacterized protein (UPF0303 family)
MFGRNRLNCCLDCKEVSVGTRQLHIEQPHKLFSANHIGATSPRNMRWTRREFGVQVRHLTYLAGTLVRQTKRETATSELRLECKEH